MRNPFLSDISEGTRSGGGGATDSREQLVPLADAQRTQALEEQLEALARAEGEIAAIKQSTSMEGAALLDASVARLQAELQEDADATAREEAAAALLAKHKAEVRAALAESVAQLAAAQAAS